MTGRTIGEEARAAQESPGQEVVRPLDNPLKETGGLPEIKPLSAYYTNDYLQ